MDDPNALTSKANRVFKYKNIRSYLLKCHYIRGYTRIKSWLVSNNTNIVTPLTQIKSSLWQAVITILNKKILCQYNLLLMWELKCNPYNSTSGIVSESRKRINLLGI